jgi:replicative DNA helicase
MNLNDKLNSINKSTDIIPEGIAKIVTQDKIVRDNIDYVRKRASGEIKALETCYKRLNKAIGGGFESNTILTLAGLSGTGKSSISKRLINSITENVIKSGRNCVALSFNFEMLAHKTVGREIANMSKMTLKELYSSDSPLSEYAINKLVKEHYDKINKNPIIYVEEPEDHVTIGNTIYYYWNKLCKKDKTIMVVEIDHAVITKGKSGDNQKDKIDDLMETLNKVKKKIASQGGEVFYIVLSQMNRDIKHRDRVSDPQQHYPISSDLFSSSAMEHFSDYILITHTPAKLHLKSYTDNKFPTILLNEDDQQNFIYWHIVKNRDGEPDIIIPMLDNLKYFEFEEISGADFVKYHKEFSTTGKCVKQVDNPK